MCEQCLVNPLNFGEPMPGWFLIRARRENDMKVGQWGLVEANDPTFVWTTTPKLQPNFQMTIDEEEAFSIETGWHIDYDIFGDFHDAFDCSPNIGYKLVKSCMAVGYIPDVHYDVREWLFSYLALWIHNNEPTVDADPFPHLDETCPHDYTIWKD